MVLGKEDNTNPTMIDLHSRPGIAGSLAKLGFYAHGMEVPKHSERALFFSFCWVILLLPLGGYSIFLQYRLQRQRTASFSHVSLLLPPPGTELVSSTLQSLSDFVRPHDTWMKRARGTQGVLKWKQWRKRTIERSDIGSQVSDKLCLI